MLFFIFNLFHSQMSYKQVSKYLVIQISTSKQHLHSSLHAILNVAAFHPSYSVPSKHLTTLRHHTKCNKIQLKTKKIRSPKST